MKKLLLSLATVLCCGMASAAETSYTIEFTTRADNNGAAITASNYANYITADSKQYVSGVGTTITNASNGIYGLKIGTNKGAGEVTFNLTSAAQVVPTKVVIKTSVNKNPTYQKFEFNDVAGDAYTSSNINADYATFTFSNFTSELKSIKFEKTNASNTTSQQGFIFVKSITVYYDGGGSTGSPAELSFPQPSYTNVLGEAFESPELTNPYGLTVAYDSSDKTVATVDTDGKVTIEGVGTTTISATSAATDTYSEGYASYTLTVLNSYATLQEYINGTPNKNDKAIMGAELTVVYLNGQNIYVKDETASSLIFANNNLGYEVGSVIPGGWVGVTDVYNDLYEIKPESTLPASTSKVDVTYPEITEAITAADVNKVAWFKNVVFSAATPDTKTNWTVSVNGADVQFRNNFTLASVDAGTYNVLGAVSIFKGTLQIFPIEYQVVGDVKETVATPVILPGSGEIEANTKITITCATEGATIYYTVDGNDPTTESAVYGEEPIIFTEAMTVKAFAVKEGMIDSEIASAEYTLYDPSIVKPTYVTFDFTDPSKYDLTPATQGGNGIDLCTAANPTVTFTEGDVSLKIDKKNSTNNPRLWTVATGQYEVRLYTNTVVTFSSSNNNIRIEKIVFEQNKTDWGTTNTYDPNTFDKTSMTWNGGADDKPQSTFTMTVGAKTFFNKATVYFKDYTAVEGIEADENVEPVYYNLQGVRVANPEKGLYIVVKSNKSSKVMF